MKYIGKWLLPFIAAIAVFIGMQFDSGLYTKPIGRVEAVKVVKTGEATGAGSAAEYC